MATANKPDILTPAVSTPHPATILDTTVPSLSFAVAVTEQHGLSVKPIDIAEQLPFPFRPTGTRKVTGVESFLDELARRPLPETAGTLWGNPDRGNIKAIYNDHTNELAGWRDDILELALSLDVDWQVWHQLSGKYFRQEEFGDKIEELRHTIVRPEGAEVLEIIDSVRASSQGEFESRIARSNGSQTVSYKTEVTARAGTAGRELKVPETITLTLTPWDGHSRFYQVDAYFRLKIVDNHLALAVKLFPTRQVVRDAWSDLVGAIAAAVSKPVYLAP